MSKRDDRPEHGADEAGAAPDLLTVLGGKLDFALVGVCGDA